MAKEKKSYDLHIDLPACVTRDQMMGLVERAAAAAGLTISHIGSYSRKKYPNSVHWHFKRSKDEKGLIDATYWDVGSLLWLMIRYREPAWVHKAAPILQAAMAAEIERMRLA